MAEAAADELTKETSTSSGQALEETLESLVALRAALGQRAELAALDDLRQRTWARDVEASIEQAFAALPESTGPLNSQGLVGKALIALEHRAPEYLKYLASYLDTLLWLEEQS